jgi:GH24 family phage-related lysozyme (muramidase)
MMPKPGDYCQNFNQQQPHHMAWLQAVLERLVELDPKALDRDQPLYGSWMPPQAQQQQDTRWLEPARKIVSEFEGCRLEAYRDAVGVLTIGYGHTGPAVVHGMKITQSAADLMLQQDLMRFHAGLLELLPMIEDWPGHQQAALVSWAFNVGLGAVKTSTLRQKLLAGQDPAKVVREELPRWNKVDGRELAGLTRRRAAEVALFSGPQRPQLATVTLQVPYELQIDNTSGTGYRECFSSSCAMVAEFYGKVKTDDEYNRIRARHGDTTDPGAQLRALGQLGLRAEFKRNGDAATLERIIRDGRPVPVGWLHQGRVQQPRGGGHWTVVIGFTPAGFIHNDPNGEADMVGGGYINHSNGAGIEYSRANWLRRWEVDGKCSGWYLDIRA